MPIYKGRRPGTWRVTIFAQGRQHEWIVEGKRAEARIFESQKRVEHRARPVAKTRTAPTFFNFCVEQYRPHAERHLGDNTWRKVRVYQVATLEGHFGPLKLDAIRSEHIDAFKTKRLAEVKRSSINNELRVFRRMLRWAEEIGLPVAPLKIKMLPRDGKPRVHCWSTEEVQRVYASAQRLSPELLPLIVFLVNTGCRKGEAIAAEWSWVDMRTRMLRIPVTEVWSPKDKEPREIPLSLAAMSALRKLPRRSERWIFPNRLGARFECFPEKAFRRVTSAAKVTGGPHTTRHTFASHFLRAKPDVMLLARVMGHSQTRVTELYTHLLPGHLKEARNAVNLSPLVKASPRLRLLKGGKTLAANSGGKAKTA